MNPWPVEADGARGPPAAPRPRRPRRRPEVRLHRRPQRARARQRARDRGARGRRRARQGVPARARRRGRLARHADRLRARARARRPRARGLRRRRRLAGALPGRRARRRRWSRRSTCCASATSRSAASSRCARSGSCPGLGSHVSWEERLDGRIGLAMLSIQAIKGCGIGDGFDLAGRPGSAAHDEIFYDEERGYYRETNRSGGVEGGMTTGEPLVVRCAMKPLPTLTKPLRSVDIATREPAEALRERTDSCTVPAAGVVGEAMLAIVLASAYREKFGGDHIDDVRAALAAYEERIGWKRRRPETPAASSSSASWGRASRSPRAPPRAALGVARGRLRRRCSSSGSGSSIEAYFASHGERAFREQEEEAVAELLERAARAGASRSAAARSPPSACATALARHTVVLLDVDADTAWQRAAAGRPLARDRDRFEALHAERAPLYAGLADAILPADRRDEVRRALPAIRALADAPRRHEAAVGGRVPGVRGRRAARRRACGRSRGPALPRHRRDGRRAATPTGSATVAARRPHPAPGERHKTLDDAPTACCARSPRRGHGPRRPRGRARRRRGRRRRGLLRGGLPARRAGRAGADHARRPGRLRLRRQDRRRPARGQELRRRLPPAGGRARRPGARSPRCRRRSSPRAGPRWSRPALIAGGDAVAARALARAPRSPTATSCSPARA